MLVAGYGCSIYFVCLQLVGILFVMFISISIVLLTIRTLEHNELEETQKKKQSTFTVLGELIFWKPIEFVKEKFAPRKRVDEIKVLQRIDSTEAGGDVEEGKPELERKESALSTTPTKGGEFLSKMRSWVDSRPVLILSIILIAISSLLLVGIFILNQLCIMEFIIFLTYLYVSRFMMVRFKPEEATMLRLKAYFSAQILFSPFFSYV
jgi:hypothetical protein